ncbi:hypothetical protein QR680_012047 [Steinernema hermaphroditum]|uniref:UPAR/Ly6 domain-containing protein n=1 Tax=Steinernema hermaphroditum TaxID=289476 RepID=A0AA39I2B0_9BILA|nr:hypothetical protein QR680_012047 [Steinernema hermaphroditum]
MLLAYAAVLLTASAVHGCAPNSKGGTCYSGLLFDNQPPQELAQFESCKEDLKRDWCTVVYNQDSAEAEFHCYNHYNTNPLLGYPVCGDETHVEVNSGGCKRVPRQDGRYCLVCCCRGANCNNPMTFRIEQQRYQSGQVGWKSASRCWTGISLVLFAIFAIVISASF